MIKRAFNTQLAYLDNEAVPHPYLAEALPQLNTESRRVDPDGRMQTTWKLNPRAVWHDGTPLSAKDFVLTWKVYATPELGHSQSPPLARWTASLHRTIEPSSSNGNRSIRGRYHVRA